MTRAHLHPPEYEVTATDDTNSIVEFRTTDINEAVDTLEDFHRRYGAALIKPVGSPHAVASLGVPLYPKERAS